MLLPAYLQQRCYVEWNYLVKGLMEVWDMACTLNMECHVEQSLLDDAEGQVAEWLGDLGNRLCQEREARHNADLKPTPDSIMLLLQALTLIGEGTPLPPASVYILASSLEDPHPYYGLELGAMTH